MPFHSPLRYPGGKRKLANFIKLVFETNSLLDGDYIEPYAGGASIALALLFEEYARNIWINDIDKSVYAFWYSVLNITDALCRLINDTPVNMDEWQRQKALQNDPNTDLLQLGFSTFYLNRTNRSGIISGGVIGGKEQKGKWKLNARYNKKDLISRIEKIARFQSRIHLGNQDAILFLQSTVPHLPDRSLLYLDPPYFVKGQQMLYKSYYRAEDHQELSRYIASLNVRWIVSYDETPEIRALYRDFRSLDYSIHYSAQDRYKGAEVMFFCDQLIVDEVADPSKVKRTLANVNSQA